jgi:hypothetical protein
MVIGCCVWPCPEELRTGAASGADTLALAYGGAALRGRCGERGSAEAPAAAPHRGTKDLRRPSSEILERHRTPCALCKWEIKVQHGPTRYYVAGL